VCPAAPRQQASSTFLTPGCAQTANPGPGDLYRRGMASPATEQPAEMNARQRLIWELFDFSTGRGLEIGPLHATVVPRERADVRYVDVFDRDQLVAQYEDNPGVPCELIPEIDYPLLDGDRVRSIPEAVGEDAAFDWVMASHVIEHVPDVIGWLDQIAQVMADGGHLVLAVPDRRYCFDLHRPGSSLGQMLQANELGDTVPSVRAVYDYFRGHTSVKAPVIWGHDPPGYDDRIYPLETVLSQVERARRGEYVDSHVWTFTPGSFLEQMVELRLIGRSQWKVASLVPTKRNQLEFYAVLERLPRGAGAEAADVPAEGPAP
jgi:SAM-dependent methyltransferase